MSSDQSGDESLRRGSAAPARRGRDSALLIVHVYPHLLGTYGDAGNALVLHRRAQLRGIDAEIVPVHPGERLPRTGDVYLLGGGEDAKQTAAAQELRDDGGLAVAARSGAAIVGICAGYQLLGETFLGVGGATTPGLGLLDVRTGRLDHRAVGNMLADPVDDLGVPTLIGFENHGGATHLGPGAQPLGRVRVGVGNGDGGTEGAFAGNVYGTYFHGPVLALNPALADRVLGHAAGALEPLDDALTESLRRHRLGTVLPATARAGRRRSLLGALRRHESTPSGATASLSSAAAGQPSA
jgi:CobQ-like glutamine amidotransferase family enzyme